MRHGDIVSPGAELFDAERPNKRYVLSGGLDKLTRPFLGASNMFRRMPSLNALRAFEAAARHLSFKEAGQELHVTPAAISQQVRALEEEFGLPLFVRNNRSVALTDAGRLILPEVRQAFETLQRATQRLRELRHRPALRVASAPAFAAKWLVPNLERFYLRHPGIDVHVIAKHELADYDRENIDIGVRYGLGSYPG
jgi:LysR family glycine cleavage system transcriptional activator